MRVPKVGEYPRLGALLLLASCNRLPEPVSPIVPTPAEAWRSSPPATSPVSAEDGWPEVLTRPLASGLTIIASAVASAPYTEVSLVVPHDGLLLSATKVSTAIAQDLEHDVARLAPSHTLVDLDGLTLTWRVRAEQLDSALATIASLLETAPSQQALVLANKDIARVQRLPAMDAALTAREELRTRLYGPTTSVFNFEGPPSDAAIRDSAAELESFHALHFAPSRAAVVIVGPMEPASACDRVASKLGTLVNRSRLSGTRPLASAPRHPVRSVVIADHGHAGAMIEFGIATAALRGEEALENEIIGGLVLEALSQRLDRELRQQRALTTKVELGHSSGTWGGLLEGRIATDEGHVLNVLDAVRAQVRTLRDSPAPNEYTHALRRSLLMHNLRSAQPDKIAAALGRRFAGGRPTNPDADQRLFARLLQTNEAGLRVAARHILGDPFFVVAGRGSNLAAVLQFSPIAYEMAH